MEVVSVVGMHKKNEMKKEDQLGDADVINLENAYELEYWTSQLKVTHDELRDAVAEVGNRIEVVKVYLNKA